MSPSHGMTTNFDDVDNVDNLEYINVKLIYEETSSLVVPLQYFYLTISQQYS